MDLSYPLSVLSYYPYVNQHVVTFTFFLQCLWLPLSILSLLLRSFPNGKRSRRSNEGLRYHTLEKSQADQPDERIIDWIERRDYRQMPFSAPSFCQAALPIMTAEGAFDCLLAGTGHFRMLFGYTGDCIRTGIEPQPQPHSDIKDTTF